ncbi:Tetratricopeptide repeat-containing protein [Rutstroemia sp. NJR-2017a BVV2]|nr:Tetratricopeptide repeat-containing protein [Rutstroemia sp. NJR-2017a BVV2]
MMSRFRKRQTLPATGGDGSSGAGAGAFGHDRVPSYRSAVGYPSLDDVKITTSFPQRSHTIANNRENSKAESSTAGETESLRSKSSVLVPAPVPVNIDDIWREVRALERHNHGSSRYSKVGRTIEPVIDFLARYAPVVDMMVQGTSTASLVWGSLKGILLVAQTSVMYFQYIDTALVRLGDVLSISKQYEKMFESDDRVKNILKDLYGEIYVFLEKIRVAVSVGSLKIFMKNIRKSFETEFKDNLAHMERYTRLFNDEVTLAHRKRMDLETQNIKSMVGVVAEDNAGIMWRADRKELNDAKEGVLKWLTQVDPREDYYHALKRRASGTGTWLLGSPTFEAWKNYARDSATTFPVAGEITSPTLWIQGRPGTGKTVLSSTTIEHLQKVNDKAVVAFFYCNSGDAQKTSTLNIMGSILAQLVAPMNEYPSEILSAYGAAKKYGRQHISPADNVEVLIRHVLEDTSAAYIVLDGLDECVDPVEVARAFMGIARDCASARLACFSRKIPVISIELEGAVTIELDAASVQPDIDKFLNKSLSNLPGKGTEIQDRAFSKLSNSADGMFLYAALGVQNLTEAVDSQSILEAVSNIPAGLNGVYGQILERMGSQSIRRRVLARKILLWVCFTTRPLSWKELQRALSWDATQNDFVGELRPFKDAVIDLCAPLIEYRPEKDSFHPIHLSVREFLARTHDFSSMSAKATQFLITESHAHHTIAEVTIAALSSSDVMHNVDVDPLLFPLVRYATENWCHHLSSASYDANLCQRFDDFASSELSRSTWILRFLVMNKQSFPLQRIAKYQKEVHDWKHDGASKSAFTAEDLADIQRALIDLDHLPLSNTAETISNFERDLIVRDLARAYTMAGKVDQAIYLFSSALTRTHKSLGRYSLRTTWLLNSLGIMYDQKHLTDLAVQTQLQALAIQERYLPADHLDIALTVNELGRITRHLHHYEESEAYHLRALSILRQALPENDLQIIWTINTLARNYRFQLRYEEALALHRQALEGQISLMGEDHPHPIRTRWDIARILQDQGKYKEALKGMEDVYEARVRVLGVMNPDTLWTMNNIGLLWELLGERGLARECQQRAWIGQKEVLGKEHKHTMWTAAVLERLGADGKGL